MGQAAVVTTAILAKTNHLVQDVSWKQVKTSIAKLNKVDS